MNSEIFSKKLTEKTVFFKNEIEGAVIKSVPGKGFFVKFKGKPEFKAKQGSAVVTDGLLQPVEISEKEYNNF